MSVPPTTRSLRVFAFDPSLTTEMANFDVSEVVVRIPWERDREWARGDKYTPLSLEPGLSPGPIGDYLEVVDVDPASGRAYPPVDLNDPYLIATDGLAPSEGNPQFHQQMVYAVATTTIQHFERALGRQVFWSPTAVKTAGGKTEYFPTQRLRIYPHALSDENAFYDPQNKALLFGYFPTRARVSADGQVYGSTLSCLSKNIFTYGTTRAILDGMQRIFSAQSDVLAFHEALPIWSPAPTLHLSGDPATRSRARGDRH